MEPPSTSLSIIFIIQGESFGLVQLCFQLPQKNCSSLFVTKRAEQAGSSGGQNCCPSAVFLYDYLLLRGSFCNCARE